MMSETNDKVAGVLAPVTSLRHGNDLGMGDVKGLRELVDWAAAHGVRFLQLLPINETGADHSPYNAISSVALEPSLIDLSSVPEIGSSRVAEVRESLSEELLKGDLVNYEEAKRIKRELLEEGYVKFVDAGGENADFSAFCAAEKGWLENYTRFRLLMDEEGGRETWDLWSINYQGQKAAHDWIDKKRGREKARVENRLRYYAWVQWIAFSQWRALREESGAKGVKLMGDIPIGISYYSADVFFEREGFDLEWCGGAPPETVFKDDAFTQKWGQNWGIPAYRWDLMEKDNFAWWRRRIDKLTDVFHIFRIDHILGFYRIYSFPWRPQRNAEFLPLNEEEAAARTGGRLPGFKPFPDDTEEHCAHNLKCGDKYLKAVQEAAGDGEVVGEDLGAVPHYVRPHLEKVGIAGFKICHWEAFHGEDGLEHPIPGAQYLRCSFATYATHDHPSIAGMWEEFRANIESHDEDERVGALWNLRILSEFSDLTLPDDGVSYRPFDEKVKIALLKALVDCNSRYAALMITDIYGMTERFNIPGTLGGKNWRIRMPFTVAEMSEREDLAKDAAALRNLIIKAER
ncbi:MAG: 4-alpha-glucanotransferase [Verrucomicrobiaceae bacterium]